MTSQQLFAQCSQILNGPYPASMKEIEMQVSDPGFFPGTSGFFHSGSLTDDVRRPFMFVGQDFGTVAYLSYLQANPQADIKEGTGRILKNLLAEAGINTEDCFFTNALFGVRVSDEITGLCQGWKEKAYVAKCRDAFELQLAEVQPRVLICLGRDAPRMLRLLFPKTRRWQQWSFAKIDDSCSPHSILEIVGHATVLAAGILVHPSFHHANVWRREFNKLKGRAAEVALLQQLRQWSKS